MILAAGDSIRMGSPKALLAGPDGRPFVASIVRALASAKAGMKMMSGRAFFTNSLLPTRF